MKKNISYLLLLTVILSCSNPSNLNIGNTDPNTLVSKPTDNTDPNTLVSKPTDNTDPNTLVSKPTDNTDPNTLVSKPTDNTDPNTLVSKPTDNTDPEKFSFTKMKGFTEIKFNQGNYEVNLNVDLTELSILRILANSNKQNTAFLELTVRIDKKNNNKFKIDRNDFIDQSNFIISIKGIKESSNLYVDIIAKDSNNKNLVEKQLINQQINENKSINSSLYKENSSQNNNNQSSTNNQNSNSNNSKPTTSLPSSTSTPIPTPTPSSKNPNPNSNSQNNGK
jgi:hypothetical protein